MLLTTRLIALAGLALVLGCAAPGSDPAAPSARLEHLYPLGAAPPQDTVEIRFVRAAPIGELAPRYEANAIERMGSLDTSLATEFYAYDASRPMGVGAGLHVNRRCDYVLLDPERRILGAFRVKELC